MATERQDKLLAAEDARFHAIGPGGNGRIMIATTEFLDKVTVSFGLPSAPALLLNVARSAHLRRAGTDFASIFVGHPPPQGTWPESHVALFDYFENITTEVICSFTAVEAFANEVIPSDFTYEFKSGKKQDPEILTKPDIERRVALDEKLKKVIPAACHVKSPAGTKVWQEYKELKLVRDRLIHLKSIDRKSSGPEHQTLWGLLLEKRLSIYPDMAAHIVGHFGSLVGDRRWFKSYIPIKV